MTVLISGMRGQKSSQSLTALSNVRSVIYTVQSIVTLEWSYINRFNVQPFPQENLNAQR